MKPIQAWGWLAAGVLALGLNGAYQDGAAEWARRAIEPVVQRTTAVLALASGRADQFLAEARALMARDETVSPRRAALAQGRDCRLATALAQVQTSVARSGAGLARVETLSARQEAQLTRLEANRARMEGQLASKAARFRAATASFNFSDFDSIKNLSRAQGCTRVRVTVPRPPLVRIPVPVIHVEVAGLGPA
ncbi:MAG TPA: hypothetical protein VJ999_06085 [Candidatus Sulfotelmatobacter sp.]|nr:hypothetical protein [Candidatus Sulfotelmatobacter sp.]